MDSCIRSMALTPRAGSLEWPDWPTMRMALAMWPLVCAHRLQRGWFADDGEIRPNGGGGGEITCAGHRRFFICGSQNVQRLGQFARVDVAHRIQNKGEEAFHVGGAQAVELVVVLGQG